MLETLAVIGIFGLTLGAISTLYYKMGKLESKVNFIYDNVKTVVTWVNNNNKK